MPILLLVAMRPVVTAVNLTTPGQSVAPSRHVTLIVGPNNVGKSAILAGIHQEIATDPNQPHYQNPRPVESVHVDMPQLDELVGLMAQRARLFPAGAHSHATYGEPTYVLPNGGAVPQSYVFSAQGRSSRFGSLAASMTLFMGPEGRGSSLGSQGLPDLMNDYGRTPMQMLWEDRGLETRLNSFMQRAFGRSIVVNRHAGANVHLHIGEVEMEEPAVGLRSPYLEAVMKLPLLSVQGAGMQAFMGTMLTLASGNYDIVLLDEPETFLHPPQARLLGEVVAEMSRDGGPQVIVATHSDDFVQGVLDGSKVEADVSVVRITRPADLENRVAQVDPESIRSLYRDPLLRYSRILDGIFYKGVVLCEAESDCTYYSAALTAYEGEDSLGASDLLFTHCGGKDRLQRAFEALDAAKVPTAVIADIDLLSDLQKFKSLFEAMGGVFDSISASYNVLTSSIRNHRVQPNREVARREVLKALDGADDEFLSNDEMKLVVTAVRAESGWSQIKRKGVGAIDSGDPLAAFESILSAGKAVGLFLLAVGELERFHPDIGGNKQTWLRTVLERELFATSTESRTLVADVRKFVSSAQ